MNNLKFIVGKGSYWYDYSELICKVIWSGRKGAAPRSAQVVFQDSEGYGHARTNLNCGDGTICTLSLDSNVFFQGLLMTDGSGSKRQLTAKFYDNCIYLANNKDSFSYTGKRADEIFQDCISKLNLPSGDITNTGHIIAELVKPRTSFWDVIQDALSQTYASTGKRYYVSSDQGKISLKRRLEQKNIFVLEPDANIETYDMNRSIYNTRTRLKMFTSDGEIKRSYTNDALEATIGMFQDVDTVDENITATELQQRVDTFIAEKALVQQDLKVTCAGNINIKSGSCVYVRIPHINTKRVMYVDEDTHIFENGSYKMILKLSYAKDIDVAG